MPRIVPETACADTADEDGIVVCARRDRGESYRLPEQFREAPLDDRDVSPAARARDETVLGSYSTQAVGPFGYLEHSREIDCEWRAERQALRGARPDCTRNSRPPVSR